MKLKFLRKNMRIKLASHPLAAIILCFFPLLAMAQSSSLIFERAQIHIVATPKADSAPAAPPTHAPIALSVELRPEDALRLEYIHTLNTLTPETGVMIALDAPASVAVPAFSVYTPVDILFIGDDGTIVQIAPNIILGDMTQTIQARVPIKALLFLKAGEAAARTIRPQRDVVTGKMFSPTPPVQE